MTFNTQLSNMNQNDMYPTDVLFPLIFNFTEKDSPIEHFEVLGYTGSNFVPLTGSSIINIGLALLTGLGALLAQIFCVLLHRYEFARKAGAKI